VQNNEHIILRTCLFQKQLLGGCYQQFSTFSGQRPVPGRKKWGKPGRAVSAHPVDVGTAGFDIRFFGVWNPFSFFSGCFGNICNLLADEVNRLHELHSVIT
jgi:hypothetical protein